MGKQKGGKSGHHTILRTAHAYLRTVGKEVGRDLKKEGRSIAKEAGVSTDGSGNIKSEIRGAVREMTRGKKAEARAKVQEGVAKYKAEVRPGLVKKLRSAAESGSAR